MPPRKNKDFLPGDIVLFKGKKRLVLEKRITGDGIELYHIFNPETGIYSAYQHELEYVDHLFEWEAVIGKMNEIEIKKAG